MPAKDVKDLGNGLTRTTFATSPKMSTYLLFLGVGDFDRATLTTDDGVEVGDHRAERQGRASAFCAGGRPR